MGKSPDRTRFGTVIARRLFLVALRGTAAQPQMDFTTSYTKTETMIPMRTG